VQLLVSSELIFLLDLEFRYRMIGYFSSRMVGDSAWSMIDGSSSRMIGDSSQRVMDGIALSMIGYSTCRMIDVTACTSWERVSSELIFPLCLE